MSTEIISLSSSDEEDNIKPPPLKKPKTLNLTECTLSIVPVKKKTEEEISVVIDSDEEIEEKSQIEVANCDPQIVNNKHSSNEFKEDVDLITLTDDEIDEYVEDVRNNGSETNGTSEDTETSLKDNVITNNFVEKCGNSIMINDSDEEPEKQNGENNNNQVNRNSVENGEETRQDEVKPSTSQGKTLRVNNLFKEFLQLVQDKVTGSTFEEMLPTKMPVIQKYFNKYDIKKSVNSNAANCAVISFHKVCKELKAHIYQTTVEIEEDDVRKVKMLEKTIHLLTKKIKQLEETEVNFEADNNSAYIQLDRYQVRLSKVYKKYCEYLKQNPYIGRPIYDRITFVSSNCNIINLALTKKYNNSVHFPSYYELRKYIKKVVDKHKLDLTEDDIDIESKKCFKSLGSILQKKRRQELYDSHLTFIETSEDPAKNDVSLDNALRKSQKEGEEKIKEVCQRFVDLEDRGEDHVSTEGDSSVSESEEVDELNNRSHKIKEKEEEKNEPNKEKEVLSDS
ncbi:hypothetical protein GWI33_018620 [Rhynchophorus ferrugineus]|uniref:Daxx histone-binding domain-containing protein n=1 Tax=Rhynchophorus ferrugineus TaxID=354439 RepID=A0A834M4Z2_RHYFE|nr:hypothetical protein GWI33_018620 [Rhynchophorus ferrugineus]